LQTYAIDKEAVGGGKACDHAADATQVCAKGVGACEADMKKATVKRQTTVYPMTAASELSGAEQTAYATLVQTTVAEQLGDQFDVTATMAAQAERRRRLLDQTFTYEITVVVTPKNSQAQAPAVADLNKHMEAAQAASEVDAIKNATYDLANVAPVEADYEIVEAVAEDDGGAGDAADEESSASAASVMVSLAAGVVALL